MERHATLDHGWNEIELKGARQWVSMRGAGGALVRLGTRGATRRSHANATAALEGIGRPVRGSYAGGTKAVEVQRRWLGSLGSVAREPGFLTRWMLSILTRPDYPIRTKLRFTKAMARSMDLIWPELGPVVSSRRVR